MSTEKSLKKLVPKNVSESFSKNLVPKKDSESVNLRFWVSSHWTTDALLLKVYLIRDSSPNRDLFDIWVLIGSLFIFQGPYLQCFGLIHTKKFPLGPN